MANTGGEFVAQGVCGWRHPQQLLLGNHPQSSFLVEGNFDYYALLITPAPEENPWESIVVTTTPTGGGQQDLYATTNRSREPGPEDYDVKSSNWVGSSTLVFSETAPGFCTDCTIYVGVYGYKKGGYSIVASQGLTRLQEGFPQQGLVGGEDDWKYYEFFNPPGHGKSIQVVATALTGDPDIYVTVGGSDLPGPNNFYWMGGATGADFINISASDQHFCDDCAYQIGLTSAANASYTVSVYRGDEGGKVAANGMRYYLLRPESDTTKLTVTLTKSTGEGDLWTSRGQAEDTIVLDGNEGTADPYLIGVSGVTDVTFSVVGTFSQACGPVACWLFIGKSGVTDVMFSVAGTFSQGVSILQEGVPQRHTLEAGSSMAFGFLVDQDNVDLQLTVTPMRGDPALYAGMGATPSCAAPEEGGESGGAKGGGEGAGVCSGWTWSCTSGGRRNIPISHLHPCDVLDEQHQGDSAEGGDDGNDAIDDADDVDDGEGVPTSNVEVSDKCAPSSFGVGMMFMTVVAQGGMDASFSVMASLVGKHVTLVTGVPQHAVTSPMVPCGEAKQTEQGPCSAEYETSSVMQEALFVFKVGAGSVAATTGFSLSLVPECAPGSCGGPTCASGCPRRPAKVYVKSCPEDKCLPEDRFPSQGSRDKEFEVSSADGSVFIADGRGSAGDGVFCVPSKHGDCVYYIAVTAGGADEPAMQLTATADVPTGVSLVVPCIGDSSLPDGMIVNPANRVPLSGMKLYELCSKGEVDFQVSVESCRGEVELFVCDDTCPGLYPSKKPGERMVYTYMSDGKMVCTKHQQDTQCHTPSGSDRNKEVSVTVEAGHPEEGTITTRSSTYFVGVGMRPGQRAEDQEHLLRVKVMGEEGVPVSPSLSAKFLPSGSDASRAVVGGREATVEWGGATLHTPKLSGRHPHEAEDRDCGIYCSYEVYAVPTRLKGEFPHTACGLESLSNRLKMDVVYKFVGNAKNPGEVTQTTLQGLRDEEHYVFVVATCDFVCLEALLRMQCSRSLGSVHSPCKPQNVVFPAAHLIASKSDLTPTTTGDTGSGGGSSSRSETTRSPVFLMVALLAVVGGVLYALNRQPAGRGSSTSYAPAQSGGIRWLGGWGASSGGGRAAGFELTDLQRRGRGDNGLGEFLIGDGRGRGDAESGPAYASLLPGQGR
ncbi:unnamed protein product [Ectocarpus sp. CCAP 1310/34]|nr:unnamed protein product [Ectocarpus sp. CCAP 1310/34]